MSAPGAAQISTVWTPKACDLKTASKTLHLAKRAAAKGLCCFSTVLRFVPPILSCTSGVHDFPPAPRRSALGMDACLPLDRHIRVVSVLGDDRAGVFDESTSAGLPNGPSGLVVAPHSQNNSG